MVEQRNPATTFTIQDIFNRCFREDLLYLRFNTDIQTRNPILEAPGIRLVDSVSVDLEMPQQMRGVRLLINVVTLSAGASGQIQIQLKDEVSGNYVDLAGAASSNISAPGLYYLTVYPGIDETKGMPDNVDVSSVLSGTWRVKGTLSGASPSVEFSVSAEYIA